MVFVLIINGLGVKPPDYGSEGQRFETALPPILNKGITEM